MQHGAAALQQVTSITRQPKCDVRKSNTRSATKTSSSLSFFIIVDRSFNAPQAEYFGLCLLDTPTTVQPEQLMLQDYSTKDEKEAKAKLKISCLNCPKKTQRSRDQENKEIH